MPEQLEQIDPCLTANELARILGVNRLTIYRQAAAHQIPSFKIATALRFDPRAVAKWLRVQQGN
jgi:excisionase family DNA binding protein